MRVKGTIIWSASAAALIALSFAKYGTLSVDAVATRQLVAQFPATIQAVFGMSGVDIATLSGYYGIIYLYVAIMIAIHVGLTGASVVSEEERGRTAEFLYTKPISRRWALAQKLDAGGVQVAVLWGIVAVTSWVTMAANAAGEDFTAVYWLFMGALAVIAMVFYFLGVLFASMTKNPKLPSRILTGIVLGSYGIYIFTNLIPAFEMISFLSVFNLFDAADIVQNGALSGPAVVVCLLIAFAALVGAFVCYERRDLNT